MSKPKTWQKLPTDTISGILVYLRDTPPLTFEQYCNRSPTLFGNQGSPFRQRVYQKRWDLKRFYLHPTKGQPIGKWHDLLQSHGLDISAKNSSPFVKGNNSVDNSVEEMFPDNMQSSTSKPTAVAFDDDAAYRNYGDKIPAEAPAAIVAPSSLADQILQHFRTVDTSIDFNRMDSNEYGVYVLYGNQVDIKQGKKQAQVVTLLRPVYFFPDVLELEAELKPGGGGLLLKEPAAPSPLWKFAPKVIEGMAAAYDEPGSRKTPICKSTNQTLKTESTRIATSDQSKIISISFPKGITCNNSQFNEDADGNKLVKRIITFTATHPAFEKDGVPLEFPFSVAFWRFVVDGSERLAEVPVAQDYSSLVNRMIDGVGSLYLSDNRMPYQNEEEERRKEALLAKYQRDAEIARADAERNKRNAEATQNSTKQQQKEYVRLQEQLLETQRQAQHAAAEADRLKREREEQSRQFQAQLAETQRQAQLAAAEADRLKREREEQSQQLQAHQQQVAAREAALQQQVTAREAALQQEAAAREAALQQEAAAREAVLQQQAQRLQQQEAVARAAQGNAEGVRREAQLMLDEANRREREQQAIVAAAATAAAAANADSSTVATNPRTHEALTESDVDNLVQEFAEYKNTSYDAVMELIYSGDSQPQTAQDVIDLLYSDGFGTTL